MGTVALDSSQEAVTLNASWFCPKELNDLFKKYSHKTDRWPVTMTACYSGLSIKTCPLSWTKGFTIHKSKLTIASSHWLIEWWRCMHCNFGWSNCKSSVLLCVTQWCQWAQLICPGRRALPSTKGNLTVTSLDVERWLCTHHYYIWSNCKSSAWPCVALCCL